jgi:hypothetical protein
VTSKIPPDWAAIELAFRSSKIALRKLADEFGVTEGAIRKRAKRFAWTRELIPRINERTKEKVLDPTSVPGYKLETAEEQLEQEEAFIEQAANRAAAVLLTHQALLTEAKQAAMGMVQHILRQVKESGLPTVMLDDNGKVVIGKDGQPVEAVLGPLAYVKPLKEVAQTMAIIVDLERKTYNIGDTPPPPPPPDGAKSPAIERINALHARLVDLAGSNPAGHPAAT